MMTENILKAALTAGFEQFNNGLTTYYIHRNGIDAHSESDIIEMFDALYISAFNDGYQRGSYEQMTQEDI